VSVDANSGLVGFAVPGNIISTPHLSIMASDRSRDRANIALAIVEYVLIEMVNNARIASFHAENKAVHNELISYTVIILRARNSISATIKMPLVPHNHPVVFIVHKGHCLAMFIVGE
jgi:hypothetical protein